VSHLKFKAKKPIYIDSCPVRLAGVRCPSCHKLVDGATGLSWAPGAPVPTPGCLSICAYCGSFNMYFERTRGRLGLRRLTDAELRDIKNHPRFAKLVEVSAKAVLAVRRARK